MIKSFIVYNVQGAILRTGSCPEEMLDEQVQSGEFVIEGRANDILQYVDPVTKEVRDKPVLGEVVDKIDVIADDVDEVVISQLPNPTQVIIFGPVMENFEVHDGETILSFDAPGTYQVRLISPLHIESEVWINAT